MYSQAVEVEKKILKTANILTLSKTHALFFLFNQKLKHTLKLRIN